MDERLKEQIDGLESELTAARKNGDVAGLRRIAEQVRQVLDQFRQDHDGESKQSNLTLAKLLNLHGQSLAALFDLTGQMQQIQEAVSELGQSLKLAEPHESAPVVFAIRANLAFATLRYAEQISSRTLLGNSLRHLAVLKGDWPLDQAPPSLHPAINCYCLAKFRLGQVSGDRGLIKEACRDFSSFLGNSGLQGELETMAMNNSIVASFENARRHRNPELLKMLISYLEPRTRSLTPNLPFLLKHLANSHVEFAKITRDTTALEHAIGNFEMLCKLLRRFAHPGPLFSVLQSLAAASYQMSRNLEADAANDFLSKAIENAREAQNIIRTKGDTNDARMVSILIDLGAYQFEQGARAGDLAILLKAEEDFQTATSRSSAKRSPWLAFRASLGLFRLFCHRESWEQAMTAFEQAEEAWLVAVTDRQLSHEVHDQKVIEMEGVYSMAAHCCLMLSDLERAVEVLERGRAQKMSLSQAEFSGPDSSIHPNGRMDLELALDQWEQARKFGASEECVETWKKYETLLRQHGLGMVPSNLSVAGLKRLLPNDSVMIQIFSCPAGVFAILVFGDDRKLQQVMIPREFRAKLDLLFWSPGNRDERCWGTEYRRFREPPRQDGERGQAAFQSWHDIVEEVIDLLGSGLLQHIHEELQRQEFPLTGRVFLSPPGEFAALPLASGRLVDGTLFEEHWDVSLIPNGTFMPQEEEEITERSFLAIAHRSVGTGEAGMLRFAGREAERVGAHLRSGIKCLLTDEEASLETTLTMMREASLIHVACHGTYEIRSPGSSGIHLPGGDLLPISRLQRTDHYRLKARLVFLSCCESGITGRSIPPDEFVGLLPSILKCGARAAIGSLWPVYDDAAMFLSLKFYQLFLGDDGSQKMSPGAALSTSKLWLKEVTIAGLIQTGWISEEEIAELTEGGLKTCLLRIRPVGVSPSAEELDEPVISQPKLTAEQMQTRPFSSPVDWAPFILVGG